MQKLDLTLHLEKILVELNTDKVLNLYAIGLANPKKALNFSSLNSDLFNTKSRYDDLMKVDSYAEILNRMNAAGIYEAQNLAELTVLLRDTSFINLLTNPRTAKLFSFHQALTNLHQVAKDLLISEQLTINHDAQLDSGYLVFQIAIEEEGLEPSSYLKIISAINELLQTLQKIYGDSEEGSVTDRIILLDSGSDTNLGIRTTAENARSLFLIFKEVWDFIANYKFYKHKQKSDALMDSLTIREEIINKVKEGVITEDEAKEYTHLIKTRTDSLIGMKVLPKTLMKPGDEIPVKQMLSNYPTMKALDS